MVKKCQKRDTLQCSLNNIDPCIEQRQLRFWLETGLLESEPRTVFSCKYLQVNQDSKHTTNQILRRIKKGTYHVPWWKYGVWSMVIHPIVGSLLMDIYIYISLLMHHTQSCPSLQSDPIRASGGSSAGAFKGLDGTLPSPPSPISYTQRSAMVCFWTVHFSCWIWLDSLLDVTLS